MKNYFRIQEYKTIVISMIRNYWDKVGYSGIWWDITILIKD